MSAICNKAATLSNAALRDKKRLAGDAGIELLGAAGDLFKAAELSEHSDNPGSIEVYLSSAGTHLRQVSTLLGEVAALLTAGPVTAETKDWYQRLDYGRLYQHGLSDGEIPAGHELWSEFVTTLAADGPLGACHAFMHRVDGCIELLADGSPMHKVQSAMAELITYSRHLSYVNDIEPRDESKVRVPAVSVSGA